jgi:hypothetical protein
LRSSKNGLRQLNNNTLLAGIMGVKIVPISGFIESWRRIPQ